MSGLKLWPIAERREIVAEYEEAPMVASSWFCAVVACRNPVTGDFHLPKSGGRKRPGRREVSQRLHPGD